MNLYGNAVLKIRTNDRLHVAKEPGFVSWATVTVFIFTAVAVTNYLIPDYYFLPAVFLSVCLILSLNFMETWDLIMDKEENLVILVSRKWYHGFSMKVPEENVKRFPLSTVVSVTINIGYGIDIKRTDGSCTTIKSEQDDLRSLKKLKREIATFLHLERIEYIKGADKVFYTWDMDPWSHEWLENQEEDTDMQVDSLEQPEEHYNYGRNIKTIKGSL